MKLARHPAARLIGGDDHGLLGAMDEGLDLRAGPEGLSRAGGFGTYVEIATGGSTGAPKILRRTAASWIESFRINARLFGIDPHARVATLGDIRHSIAFYGLSEAAYLGAGLLALGGMRPDRQMAALRQEAVTHLWATPVGLRQIAPHGTAPALRHVLIGGAALDTATHDQARTAFPNARLVPFYGASETSFVALDAGLPYPGVEVEIRAGRVWVRSPYLFEDYVLGQDPDLARDGDWMSVGDLGRLEAGALFVTGRAARAVKVADRLVSPEPAEAFLTARAGGPVAVIARSDARRGHVLTAFREGGPDPDGDAELLAACRAALGAAETPRNIEPVARLPLLASGKPDLVALARLHPDG